MLGRSLYKEIPEEFQKPLNDKRLLIVSPVAQTTHRHSAKSSLVRNKYIVDIATEIVFWFIRQKWNSISIIYGCLIKK